MDSELHSAMVFGVGLVVRVYLRSRPCLSACRWLQILAQGRQTRWCGHCSSQFSCGFRSMRSCQIP